jgi:predicted alpha/beta-hydrolase family hydrolase
MSHGESEPFTREVPGQPAVRGFLHRPVGGGGRGLVLTHGAGGNCQTPLLVAVARAWADAGGLALRCDLPFRQARATGPPSPSGAARDRDGLAAAVAALRELGARRVVLGGSSYGGRQATMLAAERPLTADALLVLSYPLHPPGRASQLRTEHLPRLTTPAVFVHGTKDPFATIDELRRALSLIPALTRVLVVDGAGHGLLPGGRRAAIEAAALAARALAALDELEASGP